MNFIFLRDNWFFTRTQNLRGEIDKVCAFLGKTLSEDQVQSLLKHLHFDNLSQVSAVNFEPLREEGLVSESGRFMRKGISFISSLRTYVNNWDCFNHPIGKTGDWKNHFSPEMNSRIDEWIKMNLERSDLKFTMELDHQD